MKKHVAMIQSPLSRYFAVEEECDWLILELDYEQKKTFHTVLLWDSNGALRAQQLDCNSPRMIIVHKDSMLSSLTALSGEIPQGEWRLDVHREVELSINVLAGTGELPDGYDAGYPDRQIWADASGADAQTGFRLNRYQWEHVQEEGERWYKGDCHLHTTLTDGKMTPDGLVEHAEEHGLDFMFVTDHNMIPAAWPEAKPLVIPGMEITDKQGHFNVLGPKEWINWHPFVEDGGMGTDQGMNRIFADIRAAGGICSVNHPMTYFWQWKFMDLALSAIDVIEVFHMPEFKGNSDANEQMLIYWSLLWNEGYTIPGIGGTDLHERPNTMYSEGSKPIVIADPATHVYAQSLSAEAIKAGIRAGHVYIAREFSMKPKAIVSGQAYPPGSDLSEAIARSADGLVQYELNIQGLAQGTIQWIENGEIVASEAIAGDGVYSSSMQWQGQSYAWRRADIRGVQGELLAVVNPVYCGSRTSDLTTWGDVFERSNVVIKEITL